MKHLWALISALILSGTIVSSGVAARAATTPESTTAAGPPAAVLVSTVPAHGFYWQVTAYQEVVPGDVFITTRQAGHPDSPGTSRGTRSDEQFFEISSTGTNDVPEAALRAYHHAERVMATADPDCDISWTLLAAIGRVESNHGRFGGAELGSDGVSRPEIRGPQLNGAGPFAAIHDSDNGTLDRDKAWDRAVGQMQFLPQTWSSVARDGDGDGRMNPDDIDDSALGSAVYLCGAGGSLASAEGMSRAALRYNHSDYYAQLVLSFVAGYQTGVFALPSPPPPPAKARTASAGKAATRPSRTSKTHTTKKAGQPAAKPKPAVPSSIPKPAPKPTPTPQPSPSPSPTPTPTGPKLVQVSGTLSACGGGFCLDGNHLDLGPGRNREEFTDLVGKHVSLQVERNGSTLVVYAIGGHA